MIEIPDSFALAGPAPVEEIDAAERSLRIELPAELRDFLRTFGGGEGWWGVGYLHLYGPAELVEAADGLQVESNYPDLLVIGSDGGGELFALDRTKGRYLMTPAIGDDPSVRTDAGATLSDLFAFVADGARPRSADRSSSVEPH